MSPDRLDEQDELAPFRDRFVVDDPELIYLDGNSLGRLPKEALSRLDQAAQSEWGGRLVRGWPEGWMELPHRLGAKIARLIGAREDEVIVCDSTSVNLFKLLVAALQARPERKEVVTDDLNFPSDVYVMQGVVHTLGQDRRLAIVPNEDGIHPPTEGIERRLSEETAVLALTHVAFKSGALYDMRRLTESAHRAGALALWDLSHSVGAVPLELSSCDVDLAIGCTYKYVNGGPGAPAFLYVRRDLQDQLLSPIWGWLGERRPFDFRLSYEPAPGIGRFFAGTPPILSMTAVEAGVDLLLEAGIERLRAKSIRQTDYLVELYDEHLAPLGFRLMSPRDATLRGSHVSVGHDEAWRIDQALINEMSVIPDFRAPDSIRFGVTPLYTSYRDLYEGVTRTARVAREGLFERFSREALSVT